MATGNPQKHDSAELHVTGEAVYTDDIPEPSGCLHAYVLKSPYTHARILSADTSACFIPGVHAVVTAKDIPAVNDCSPGHGDDPVFAEKEVLYAGQSVLAVAADNVDIARMAAHKAVIRYEELAAILDAREALRNEYFVGAPYRMKTGDSTGALKRAKNVIEGELEIGGQDHFYLETQIALAVPQEDGGMHCCSSTQNPSEVQHVIAQMLGIPDSSVKTEVRRMGGGFGGKETQPALIASIAAVLAWKTKRPVKLRLDRDDDMLMTGKRHPFIVQYKAGFDDEGKIGGIAMTHLVDCGSSTDLSNAIADRAMFHSDNVYFFKNMTVTSYRCKTNKASNTAFRGFGGPQGMLAIEYIMDEVARSLGKDPSSVRKVNFYDAKGRLKKRCTTHYGMKVEDCVIDDLIRQLEKSSSYARRLKEIKKFNVGSKVLKKGLALTPVKFGISFTLTQLNQAGALVHVYKDGSVQLNHGGTEMGQGLHTKVCQIVAAVFGIDTESVKITATATDKVPNTSATAASSGTDLNGKAAEAAAKAIKSRMTAVAAKHFKAAQKSIRFENGKVFSGKRSMTFKALANLAYNSRVSLSSTGFYKTPKIRWDRSAAKGRPFLYFAYGAAAVEVIIDTLTGEYKILRADLLHEAGRSINPAIDRGQIEGAFVQGTGWLTTEELWWNNKGELKTHAPSTYKIPTARDVPADFRVTLYDSENIEDTVCKSKAVGEPPLMLANAVFLALRDAVAAAGGNGKIPHLNAPATPEEVLRSIAEVRNGQ